MVVQFNKVPDTMFYSVTMVRDIRQASFIDRKKLKRGDPDVLLVSPLGYKQVVTREELVKRYVTPNGKRIKLGHWRYNRRYVVMSNEDISMGALRVPSKSKVKIVLPNNKEIPNGAYIICPISKNGNLVKQRHFLSDRNTFNRMFRVDKKPTMNKGIIQRLKSGAVGNKRNNNIVKEDVVAKYMVVQRILNRNTGKIAGFVVSDGKGAKKLSVPQVMDMCRLKQLSNITIVEKDGKEFLRGVGIRIENLPAIIM